MRLTKKVNKGMNDTPIYVGSYGNIVCVGDNQATSMVHNKLGQLEDIEDELGIDLAILFKALKNGIYVKDLKEKIHFVRPHLRMITNTHLGLEFQCPMKWRYIQLPEDAKDYGKTWALTKEELLCQ